MELRESEWKLLAPSTEILREVPQLLEQTPRIRVRPSRDVQFLDVYVDTRDWWLLRAGVGLRLRRGPKTTCWTLKVDTGPRTLERLERIEIEQSVHGPVRFPCRLPPGPIRTWLGPIVTHLRLHPIGRLRIARSEHEVRTADGGHAIVCCDWVRAEVGERTADWAEVEWETRHDSEDLRRSIRDFRRRTGWSPVADSKIERAFRLVGIEPGSPQPVSSNLRPDMKVSEAIPAVLNRFWQQFEWLWPRAYIGVDPEALHDVRVAIRRLRAALWVFRKELPTIARTFRNSLRTAARPAGRVRDADVALDLVQRFAQAAKLSPKECDALDAVIRPLKELRTRRLRRLRACWAGRSGRALERTWARLQRQLKFCEHTGRLKPFLRDAVRAARRKATKAMARLHRTSPDADFHRVRLAAKRYRYALELRVELDGRKTHRRLKRLRDLQGCLGDLQDTVVLKEWVHGRIQGLRDPLRRRMARRLLAWLEARRHTLRARAWTALRRCR